MHVLSQIIEDFPITHPYTGVNAIEDLLLENKFLVVQDEKNQFYGILTPTDIIERPHKIVIDCLGDTDRIDAYDTLVLAYHKMKNSNKQILPVFRDGVFLGVLSEQKILHSISKEKTIAIGKLEETQKELEKEKEMSKKAEKLKEAFLHNISHEIRTPLNSLLGFANIISSSEYNDYRNEEFYQIISRSSEHFLGVLGEIIELSRIQTGDMRNHEEVLCSANFIIEELYQFYSGEKEKLDKAHIEIRLIRQEKDIIFISDLYKVKQILGYILHNAIKFTETGHVEIGYKKDKAQVVFSIKDTGIGIPIEKQERIFIAFERVEHEQRPSLSGIGLGLTIAKKLTNSIGGDIWFESEPGNGSVFYISLPLSELVDKNKQHNQL
jgi:signal transduction histidine kinase